MLFSWKFWRAATDRAIRTIAQALIAFIGTDALGWLNLDWGQMGFMAAIMGLLSVLNSVVMAPPEARDV